MSEPHCEALRTDADVNGVAAEEPDEVDEDAEPDVAELQQPDEGAVAIARSKAELERAAQTGNEAPEQANGDTGPNTDPRAAGNRSNADL